MLGYYFYSNCLRSFSYIISIHTEDESKWKKSDENRKTEQFGRSSRLRETHSSMATASESESRRNDIGSKIRYTRDMLLMLRESMNQAKVNFGQVAPLAARMGLLHDSKSERDTRRKEPNENPSSSAYPSSSTMTSSSPSSNLMPSFVNKRNMHGKYY